MKQRIFISVLKKYLDGSLTEKAKRHVEDWFSAIGKNDPVQLLTKENEDKLKAQYHAAIYKRINVNGTVRNQFPRWQVLSIAASLLVASLLGVYWFTSNHSASFQTEGLSFKTIKNDGSSELIVKLPDGSKVTLLSGGEIRHFRENNAETRTVFLSGNAFFEVTKDPKKPFLVHTDNITTRVLGTSFHIESGSDDNSVKVAVVTGSVSVFEGNNPDKASQHVVLTPNQQIVYTENEKRLISELVKAPVIIPEIKSKYEGLATVFQDAPAQEVFEAMEKLYGIPILYDAGQFMNCRITTSLEIGDFFNRMAIVCEVLDASYASEGVSIRIIGKGCPDMEDKTN